MMSIMVILDALISDFTLFWPADCSKLPQLETLFLWKMPVIFLAIWRANSGTSYPIRSPSGKPNFWFLLTSGGNRMVWNYFFRPYSYCKNSDKFDRMGWQGCLPLQGHLLREMWLNLSVEAKLLVRMDLQNICITLVIFKTIF